MAINTKEFETTRHIGIKRDKRDYHRFLIEYTFTLNSKQKRARKVFNTEQHLGKRDSLSAAYMQREQLLDNKKRTIALGHDIDEKVDAYFEAFVETRKHPVTHRNYTTVYKNHIGQYLGNLKVREVTPNDIDLVLNKMEHMSNSMRRRVWMTMKFIFELALKKKLIIESPVLEEHRVKRNSKAEKKIVQNPKKMYKAVHTSILKVFKDQPKDKALFLLGFMGRRKGEALAIRWEHIDLDNQTYVIPKETSKINEDLIFSFNDELKEAFMAIKGDQIKGRVFSRNEGTATQQALKIRKDTGIEQFTFHFMRNILVSAMADVMTVPELSALLGHQDVNTINQYLSLPRENATAKAVDMGRNLLQ